MYMNRPSFESADAVTAPPGGPTPSGDSEAPDVAIPTRTYSEGPDSSPPAKSGRPCNCSLSSEGPASKCEPSSPLARSIP